MTTITFLRHGARESGPGDTGLSPPGRQQARALARRLALQQIDAIYCSPTLCAWETAITLCGSHRQRIQFDNRLRERAAWGIVPRQTVAEYLAIWHLCNRLRDRAQPGGVSSRQAGARVQQLVEEAYDHLPDGAVVAVTHGATLMDFLRNHFSLEALARHNPAAQRDPYGNGVIPEASVTTVTYDGDRYALDCLGDAGHLARLFRRPHTLARCARRYETAAWEAAALKLPSRSAPPHSWEQSQYLLATPTNHAPHPDGQIYRE